MLHKLTGLAEQEQAPAFLQAAPFWPLNEPKSQNAIEYMLAQPGNWYLSAGQNQWHWLSGIQPLEFDSQLFGHAMARLEPLIHAPVWPDKDSLLIGLDFLRCLQAEALERNLDFLMARVNSRDMLAAQCLERAGFSLVDISVEWTAGLHDLPPTPQVNGFSVEPWQEAEREPLITLAGRSFSDLNAYADRFTLDERLRPLSAKLYETWLDNCFKGQQADQVLVLKQYNKPAGFIALRLPANGCAWVVLNAIEPALRGQGLYSYLLLAGLKWLRANGAVLARIRTKLSQQAVIQAWSRLGGRQVASDISFHWWRQ